eukprot:1114612-Rhodomonas_salina.2
MSEAERKEEDVTRLDGEVRGMNETEERFAFRGSGVRVQGRTLCITETQKGIGLRGAGEDVMYD